MRTKTILLHTLVFIVIAMAYADIKDFIIESEQDLRRLSNDNDLSTDQDDVYADEMMYDSCGESVNDMYSMMMDEDINNEMDMNTLQRLIAEAISNNIMNKDTSTYDVSLNCPAEVVATDNSHGIENYQRCLKDGSVPMTEDLFNLL